VCHTAARKILIFLQNRRSSIHSDIRYDIEKKNDMENPKSPPPAYLTPDPKKTAGTKKPTRTPISPPPPYPMTPPAPMPMPQPMPQPPPVQVQPPYPIQQQPQPQIIAYPPTIAAPPNMVVYNMGPVPQVQMVQSAGTYFVNAPQAVQSSPKSVAVQCPNCHSVVTTKIKKEPGDKAVLLCCILCILGCDLGCCFIPFVIDSLQDVKHKCPRCHFHLGKYKA